MTDFPWIPMGEVCKKVSTWNPARSSAETEFTYVDLSSVDQRSKTITSPQIISTADAPSRARQLLLVGDVIVSTVRPNLNAVAHVEPEFSGATASTGFTVLRGDPKRVDSRYLFQWVKSPLFISDMVRKATGASYPAISDRLVKESLLPHPALSEQQRIAAILDHTDSLRAIRREALVKLDELTQSIFLNMFGDPVHNDRSWTPATVDDLVAGFDSGRNLVGNDDSDGACRVLKVSAVTSLVYRETESKPLPSGYVPPVEHIVRPGDLLFSRANTSELVGATAYVHATDGRTALPDKLWRFRWHSDARVAPRYVEKLFQQPAFRRKLSERATGSSGSMKNISREKVLSIPIGIPPTRLQFEFQRRLDQIHMVGTLHRNALAQLDLLFNSLQSRAFRGEL